MRTYRVDLARAGYYGGLIRGIRLDPVQSAEPGSWVDITCISFNPCPINRRVERKLESDGGRTPLLDTFDSLTPFWSITGNSTKANASVLDGRLSVGLGAGAQPLPGQTYVGAGVYSRCSVAGDFDTRVGYALRRRPPSTISASSAAK